MPPPAASLAFVDTHAHLDDPAFDDDRDRVIERAVSAGVRTILNVGYAPDRWQSTVDLSLAHPRVKPMLGIHPQQSDTCTDEALARLSEIVSERNALAIGEIGLDFFRDRAKKSSQLAAFDAQVRLARDVNLPIVIHQRAAEAELIDVLSNYPELPPLVLHSFEGTATLADFARDRGYFVGVGGLATKAKSAPLLEVLRQLPVTSVVLETDSPYLSPRGSQQWRNEPANLPRIAEHLAPIWGMNVEEFAAQTTATAHHLFNLSESVQNEIERAAP